MEAVLILQLVVYGLMLGFTYMLVASGFTLIFGICDILNFAHGEIYAMGAMAVYYLYEVIGINFFLVLLIIMLVAGVLGIGLERYIFSPVRGHPAATLIVSLAVGWILTGSMLIILGERDHGVTSPIPGVVNIFGVGISNERIVITVISIVLISGLYFFIQRHKLGKAMRAMVQNSEAATLMGINIDRMRNLAFAIGVPLAIAAGGLLAPVFVVNPFLGWPALFKCMVVVIIGGLGSIQGVIVGSILIGLIDSFGPAFLGGFSDIIGFALVIMVLVIRPRGLLGRG